MIIKLSSHSKNAMKYVISTAKVWLLFRRNK
nr:MAG TPA: hypothetical protein [Caudoviricetes sp.]